MSDKLTAEAIEELLNGEIVARIGYVDRRGLPCVVPITYAYDGSAFYGYSLLGTKIENMCANPYVCVEVDRVHDSANWRSVVIRGTFEVLSGVEAADAITAIRNRLTTVALASSISGRNTKPFVERKGGTGIAYRIRITEKHGRCDEG